MRTPSVQACVLGNMSVGKTRLLKKFLNTYENPRPTIGLDSVILDANVTYKGSQRPFRIRLFDTAGQERYFSTIESYVKKCKVIMICYSLTEGNPMDVFSKWLVKVKNVMDADKIKLLIVGLKADLVENLLQCNNFLTVNRECIKRNLNHMTCSSIEGDSSDTILEKLKTLASTFAVETFDSNRLTRSVTVTLPSNTQDTKSGGCC